MPDVHVGSVMLDYQGQALEIRVHGDSGGLSIMGFDAREPYLELGRFEFADGTLCTGDLIHRGFDLAGTEEAEIVLGTSATDRIRGARGNDTLEGAQGNDFYFYDHGDGVDCIQDSAGLTTIVFGDGILPQDLTIAEHRSSQDPTVFLRMTPKKGGQPSEGLNVRTDSREKLSSLSFQFADGSTLTLAELQSAAKRDRLDTQALHGTCYSDAQSAARAGLPNNRSASPGQ